MGVSELKAKWGIIDQHYSRFVFVFCWRTPKDNVKDWLYCETSCTCMPWNISQHVCQTSRLGSFHLLCLAAEQSTAGEQQNQYYSFFRSQIIFPVFSKFSNLFVHISFFARCTQPNWKRTETGERQSKPFLAFRDLHQHLQAVTINETITACDTACSFSLAAANKMQVYAHVIIFK